MQCYSFIKSMMILFNFLIFVSMGLVSSLGAPYRSGSQPEQSLGWGIGATVPGASCQFPLTMRRPPQMLSSLSSLADT